MKKQNDLSALTKKISHKSVQPSIHNRFEQADHALGTAKEESLKERVIRKSYALTKQDLENIKLIKDKCLNKKIVLNDSYVIRIALGLTVQLSEDDLINASMRTPKILTGRPKGT